MAPPAKAWQRLIFGLILAWWSLAAPALEPVPLANDLAADGRVAGTGGAPVVVLFSRTPCGWCDKARREHLNAMATNAVGGALFRQVNLDTNAPLTDFAGQHTTHRAFARRHHVKMTPTLLFFGEDGHELAAPIVGYRLAEFYGTLIEDAIEDGRARLQAERR